MLRPIYRVYVDEAGDRGWGGRSTPIFVLSAVIVQDVERETLRATLDDINADLGKPARTVLHWSSNVKLHAQRKHVARMLASTPATITNVVVLKEAMIGSGTVLSDPTMRSVGCSSALAGTSTTVAAKPSSPSPTCAAFHTQAARVPRRPPVSGDTDPVAGVPRQAPD